MIKLLLYILLFLIGVLLYYIKNDNNNIEKFNISSSSLLFQSSNSTYMDYKTQIQQQYNNNKKCSRRIFVSTNKAGNKRVFNVNCDAVIYVWYGRINTDTNYREQRDLKMTYPFIDNFEFGVGIKKIISRQTRSCARPSTQYKFMFVGTSPSILDETTGQPIIDSMLTESFMRRDTLQKYFVNAHDPSIQTTVSNQIQFLMQSGDLVSDVVTDIFQQIIAEPDYRPGITESLTNLFNPNEIPRTDRQNSDISQVAQLVADYTRHRIDIGLNRKKLFSPYNLWELAELDSGIACTQTEYTDVQDFKLLDEIGYYDQRYGTHRISESQKFLFHNGLLLKNSYGGSLITDEFKTQLDKRSSQSWTPEKRSRVRNTFNNLDMTNQKYDDNTLLCCFTERLLPCSRQTFLCRSFYHKSSSTSSNLSQNSVYQNIYSPFKLSNDERDNLEAFTNSRIDYDHTGLLGHFTLEGIDELETDPIVSQGIDYLEWLESFKNMDRQYAITVEKTPSVKYTESNGSRDSITREANGDYYYNSEKSPENMNYVYGFLLCAVPELFRIAENLDQGTELYETDYRGRTEEALITIQRHARGYLTRARIATDDECAASIKKYIPSFIIEHCGNNLKFFIE